MVLRSNSKKKKLLYKTISYKKNQPYIDMINDFLLNFNKNNLATLDDYNFIEQFMKEFYNYKI